jgi:hypothetical protein
MSILVLRQGTEDAAANEAFARLIVRYNAAFALYQCHVDRNAELSLNGDKPSQWALDEEELAFDELDRARHALLDAGALAHPTIH